MSLVFCLLWEIDPAHNRLNQCHENVFQANFLLFAFFSFLAQKTLKIFILTSAASKRWSKYTTGKDVNVNQNSTVQTSNTKQEKSIFRPEPGFEPSNPQAHTLPTERRCFFIIDIPDIEAHGQGPFCCWKNSQTDYWDQRQKDKCLSHCSKIHCLSYPYSDNSNDPCLSTPVIISLHTLFCL